MISLYNLAQILFLISLHYEHLSKFLFSIRHKDSFYFLDILSIIIFLGTNLSHSIITKMWISDIISIVCCFWKSLYALNYIIQADDLVSNLVIHSDRQTWYSPIHVMEWVGLVFPTLHISLYFTVFAQSRKTHQRKSRTNNICFCRGGLVITTL